MRPTPRTILVCLAASPLCGCLSNGNERVSLSAGDQAVTIPDVGGLAQRPEALPGAGGTSLDGLSRAHWETTRILVPVDGTVALPTYATPVHWTRSTSRQRGGPVTPATALDLSGNSGWKQVWEAGASPFLGGYDLLMAPYRMYVTPPTEQVRSMPESYWRTPTGVSPMVREGPSK